MRQCEECKYGKRADLSESPTIYTSPDALMLVERIIRANWTAEKRHSKVEAALKLYKEREEKNNK